MGKQRIGVYAEAICAACGVTLHGAFFFEDGYTPEGRNLVREPAIGDDPDGAMALSFPDSQCTECGSTQRIIDRYDLFDGGERSEEDGDSFILKQRGNA